MARRKKLCCLAAMCFAAAAARPAMADTPVKVSAPTPIIQASAQNFNPPAPTLITPPAGGNPAISGTPPVTNTQTAPPVVNQPAVIQTVPSGPPVVTGTTVISGPTMVEGATIVSGPIESTGSGIFNYDWLGGTFRAPNYRFWVNADYMLATLRGTQTPPLITTSPNNIARANAGVVGTNSDIVFGGGNLDTNSQSGVRVFLGTWFPSNNHRGFEIGGFVLGQRTVNGGAFGTGATDSIAVGRPFIETNTGVETAALSAFKSDANGQGGLAGSSTASLSTNMWGAEANFLTRDDFSEFFHLTLLAGVRYAQLEQQIDAQDFSTPQAGATIPFAGQIAVTNPNSVRVIDSFQVRNQLIGGQIGARGTMDLGRFELGASGKLALGANYQTLNINGSSQVLASNGQILFNSPGGLLANSSNIGSYNRTNASIIPELELKLGYRFTNFFTAYIAYSFLYWDNVALAGNQIPRNVDLTRVPTSATFNQNVGALSGAPIFHSEFYMNTIFVGGSLKY
jgi:hypothetical protein